MSGVDNSCTTYAAASIEGLNKEPAAASNPLCRIYPPHLLPDQISFCEYDLTNNHQRSECSCVLPLVPVSEQFIEPVSNFTFCATELPVPAFHVGTDCSCNRLFGSTAVSPLLAAAKYRTVP